MSDIKVAIVTAAGRGIAAACARTPADQGYWVALMLPSGAAAKLARELGGVGVDGSVTEESDLKALVDAALEAYRRIDAVLNSTGHPPKEPILAISDQDWHTALDILVLNAVRMARLVTPVM